MASIPTSVVTSLDTLARVTDGSIVSQILLKNPGGSVTLFAFPAGEGLDEHATPADALLIGLEGEADVTLDGDRHRLRAGETLVMTAKAPHAVHASTDFRMLLVQLRSPR